ncbi:MAG: hypothetical protein L0H15_03475 [Nitrosospira sp.]|nr:hypothetical protein [Nitrosospira sp.]MDN5881534.1 hypothetical protein [Nitrosospira sp.]
MLNSDAATESQLLAAGVATALPLVLTYTWATKPNYSLTAAGTIINISDVGGEGGSLWKATSAGWVPLNGVVKLASKWGTVASPVATISGSTGALFVPTGGSGSLIIPASMLIPEHSVLRARAVMHRRGINGTATARIYLGTAGTSSDDTAYSLGIAATDTLEIRPDVEIGVVASASMTGTNWMAPGSTGSSPTAVTAMTTNINTAAAMTLSFGMDNANALDSFDLIGYSVLLESL